MPLPIFEQYILISLIVAGGVAWIAFWHWLTRTLFVESDAERKARLILTMTEKQFKEAVKRGTI